MPARHQAVKLVEDEGSLTVLHDHLAANLEDVAHVGLAGYCRERPHRCPGRGRGEGHGLRVRELWCAFPQPISKDAVVDSVRASSRLIEQLFIAQPRDRPLHCLRRHFFDAQMTGVLFQSVSREYGAFVGDSRKHAAVMSYVRARSIHRTSEMKLPGLYPNATKAA